MKSRRPPESARDIDATELTPILRALWRQFPAVLATAFVDHEGECIDYVSSLDPFETKVYAAHLQVLSELLGQTQHKLGAGELQRFEIVGAERELWGRRIDEDYSLVVVLHPSAESTRLPGAMAHAVQEFRAEVGLAPPLWEPAEEVVHVQLRQARGWRFAPYAYMQGGVRVRVTTVMGRWLRDDGAETCFRVRTELGAELTLVHHERADVWSIRE